MSMVGCSVLSNSGVLRRPADGELFVLLIGREESEQTPTSYLLSIVCF